MNWYFIAERWVDVVGSTVTYSVAFYLLWKYRHCC